MNVLVRNWQAHRLHWVSPEGAHTVILAPGENQVPEADFEAFRESRAYAEWFGAGYLTGPPLQSTEDSDANPFAVDEDVTAEEEGQPE